MSARPDPSLIIQTRSGRVLDLAGFEEAIHAGLLRRERELTSRRVRVKKAAARLSERALAAVRLLRKKLIAALRR
ncbi:hypothetical protein GTA08_BOTSDO00352 [Botryosphaeria dothidea]|uniref:Uncharacterized protein n=1 Tax=Botryosphaeria dothidea TaxID=55169 RepID=A0A8H4J9M7_9PEZI|nr:hypothetical protein GTA08_BOTSDO00352 [Botryosphaeria dothidea]